MAHPSVSPDLFPAWQEAWILHDDPDLIAVDKPPFVSTHAAEPGRRDDACSRLADHLAARGEPRPYLGTHQRLDHDTSGVLVFTRRKEANRAVAEQFEGRTVKKTYVAAVLGRPGPAAQGVLRHRLLPGKGGTMEALPPGARGGQEAVTRWRVIGSGGPRTLLELSPETGRTHQIRVQLAAAGAPIAGDERYGGPPAARLLLHAAALTLRHPATGQPVTFRSPPPPSFARWVEGRAEGLPGDAAVLEVLLRAAADRRYGVAHLPGTTALRLANGAGDGLPGVDVDLYGDHLVVALSGDEAEIQREAVLDAAAALGAAGVYLKVRPKHASVVDAALREELAPRAPVRGAPAPEEITVEELGLPYLVRLGDGFSTGIFVDQRENRRRVREMARGARVANLFAYTGAFTVAALAGGARSSVTVDVSPGALAWARRNLGDADPALHETIEADAFSWLERVAPRGERFDLVILDPPSFATTKQSRFRADGDYRRLAALAFAVLAPGGRLLACTNHRGIARAKFRRFLH
jgi:23S rRNA (cytosine1962-C5)-methyltransferase